MSKLPTDPVREIVKAVTDPITENAKAVQETAKAAQKAIDAAHGFGGFIERIIGPAADELGYTLRDRAALMRLNQRNKIFFDIKRRVEAREIHPDVLKELPFSEAVRFIESSSTENEDAVQDLWARLVTNAVDPKAGVSIKKIYTDLLKSLSSPEVFLLDLLWKVEENKFKNAGEWSYDKRKSIKLEIEEYAKAHWRKVNEEDASIAIQNLTRLRCITMRPGPSDYRDMFAPIQEGKRWAAVDPTKMSQILNHLIEMVTYSTGSSASVGRVSGRLHLTTFRKSHNVDEDSYILTVVGKDLMRACHENKSEQRPTDQDAPS